jgi:coproporphyrinogen III oxidase
MLQQYFKYMNLLLQSYNPPRSFPNFNAQFSKYHFLRHKKGPKMTKSVFFDPFIQPLKDSFRYVTKHCEGAFKSPLIAALMAIKRLLPTHNHQCAPCRDQIRDRQAGCRRVRHLFA